MRTVGIFDSGVGGLSVLRALAREVPHVHWVYVADTACAPYGDRGEHEVIDRSRRIAAWLLQRHPLDALVVACNTATACAIDGLRALHPALPIVGVEPALKTAARLTRTGHVGVLATSGTLASDRFAALRRSVEASAAAELHVHLQPCPGLADAIERGDALAVQALCKRFVQALLDRLPAPQRMDTLVLGCTHYPFVIEPLRQICGPGIELIDNAAAIARRTAELLGPVDTARTDNPDACVSLCATRDARALEAACARWLPHLRVRTADDAMV